MPRAIRLHRTGGPEILQWEEVEVGESGEGQARVRHTAIGVNFIDTYHRSGLYALPPKSKNRIGPLAGIKPPRRSTYAAQSFSGSVACVSKNA
jgi:NADPH:quinone reductase-like Zn-dependent oxidoreductase